MFKFQLKSPFCRIFFLPYILVVFYASSLSGQASIALELIPKAHSVAIKKSVQNTAQLLLITDKQLQTALSNHQLHIAIKGKQKIDLELKEVTLLSSTHKAFIGINTHTSILSGFNQEDIKFFTGTVNQLTSSSVNLTLTKHGIQGIIFDGQETYYLERVSADTIDDDIELMLYQADDIKDKTLRCLVNESKTMQAREIKQGKHNASSCKTISLAIAVDYFYYQLYNSDISEVIARTMTVMNAAALDFETEFHDSISFIIAEHFISTCASCDPWGDNREAIVYIENFSHWAEGGGFNQSYDLGQLWTGGDLQRDQSSGTVGYAFKGGLCSDKRYHVLEDYSESLWKLRHLVSHEIGHNLDASHDANGSSTIMAPNVTNTSTWSTSSIQSINSFMSDLPCSYSCSSTQCQAASDVEIIENSSTQIWALWSSASPVTVRLIDDFHDHILIDTQTSQNQIIIPGNFSDCQSLRLELMVTCDTDSILTTVPLEKPYDLALDVLHVTTKNCIPGSSPSYDIELVINHNGTPGDHFFVDIAGQTNQFAFSQSPQTITIDHTQILFPSLDQYVQLFAIINSKLYCLARTSLTNVPNQLCDLYVLENFNDCILPYNWTMWSSNNNYFPFEYTWQFDDNSRKIENYGKGNNETTDKTISGNCMAYFDDDINSSAEFTGTTVLYTDTYDISDHDNVTLSFSYLFHDFSEIKGSNNSFFSCQIWSNNNWLEILRDESSVCTWSNVWQSQCMDFFSLNLDSYVQNELRCRFIFSDSNEGDWTGMIALDNVAINAQRRLVFGCTDANSINYDPNADYDNGSCFSCENDIQDGDETAIDCGGIDCEPCITPCSLAAQTITHMTVDSTYSDIDVIQTSAVINQLNISLKPGKAVILLPGFESSIGSTFSAEISPCY